MASDTVLELTDDNFETEVLQADQPVLVDFWAEWCMPCRMLAPTIEELAGEYNGKVKVGKLDTDTNQKVAATYGISSIPTVILFQNGEIKEQFVGLRSKSARLRTDDASSVSPDRSQATAPARTRNNSKSRVHFMLQRIPECPALLPDGFTSTAWLCLPLVRNPHMRQALRPNQALFLS